MALDLSKPSRIASAVQETIRAPSWVAAESDEDRIWLLTAAVCDALTPLVPRWEAVRRELQQRNRNRDIQHDFDGRNYEDLAAGHELSTRQVRRIVDEPRKSRTRP